VSPLSDNTETRADMIFQAGRLLQSYINILKQCYVTIGGFDSYVVTGPKRRSLQALLVIGKSFAELR
jgi:hypothetical protein